MVPSCPTDRVFAALLCSSFDRLLGKPLLPEGVPPDEAARWLYADAPFALLAHDTAPDPRFVYGNRQAQQCFEYDWDALRGLPSRLSAQAPEREERRRFLEQVGRHGYVENYSGVRVARSGRQFRILDATVWQLTDEDGLLHGQAAMIPRIS